MKSGVGARVDVAHHDVAATFDLIGVLEVDEGL
jgi:hypothetical protein